MAIAARIVDFAKQERGRMEGMTPLQRKALILSYLSNVGIAGMANWCAAFVSYVVYLATGQIAGSSPKSAGARQWGRRALALGWREVSDQLPQPGDVWVFWRVTPDAWQGHIGIVVKVEGDEVTTIEGNVGGTKGHTRVRTS